ncbi:MAG: hypothetical protein BWY82_00471 [Verrucomicrobia bacterium ADurb.Bin474]|nr:MAG: hypothetical protein BWY82_00471 [Verrucomicrobia bacterium ADurb.Bin474]
MHRIPIQFIRCGVFDHPTRLHYHDFVTDMLDDCQIMPDEEVCKSMHFL